MKITVDSSLLLIMELAKSNPSIANLALGSLPKEELDLLITGAKSAATALAELQVIAQSTDIDCQIAMIPKLVQLEESKSDLAMAQVKNNIISNIGKSNTQSNQYNAFNR